MRVVLIWAYGYNATEICENNWTYTLTLECKAKGFLNGDRWMVCRVFGASVMTGARKNGCTR